MYTHIHTKTGTEFDILTSLYVCEFSS